jgi:hypothetical protein
MHFPGKAPQAFTEALATSSARIRGIPGALKEAEYTGILRGLKLVRGSSDRASMPACPSSRAVDTPNAKTVGTCPCGERFDSHDPAGSYVHREHIYAAQTVDGIRR